MKINVTEPILPDIDKYMQYVQRIWDKKWLTNNGELLCEFKKNIQEEFSYSNITLFNNGHNALEIALNMLPVKGEIITTPFTFISTTNAIVNAGHTPIFCDIKSGDYTIDENLIEELISEKTVAILPVHVYGNICNAEAIKKIANKYGLYTLYDAAHAFGELYNNIHVGNLGDFSMFSFHATKVFNTIEGGLLVYKNAEYNKKIESMINFGILDSELIYCGTNAKMNEFQAAMGLANLKIFKGAIDYRKHLTKLYVERLENINGLILSKTNPKVEYNYSYLPIIVDESKYILTRDELHDRLVFNGILARKYFFPLTTTAKYLDDKKNYTIPIAEYCSGRVLCLPLHANMTEENINFICDILEQSSKYKYTILEKVVLH